MTKCWYFPGSLPVDFHLGNLALLSDQGNSWTLNVFGDTGSKTSSSSSTPSSIGFILAEARGCGDDTSVRDTERKATSRAACPDTGVTHQLQTPTGKQNPRMEFPLTLYFPSSTCIRPPSQEVEHIPLRVLSNIPVPSGLP